MVGLGLETWPFAFQWVTLPVAFIPRAPGNWKDVRAVGDKIKVQSDDGAPDCMEAEEMGWLWGEKEGTEPQLGGWWCSFDAMGKFVGKRSGGRK